MGKQLHRKYSGLSFEDSNHSCMSGVFNILDFHQWHNVKRMLPNKRHHGAGRHHHHKGLKKSKIDQNIPITTDAQESGDAEIDKLLIEEKNTETSTTNKKSSKANIKTLIAEEMSNEDGQKHQTSALPAQLRLVRTDSIHRLEPSNDGYFEDMKTNGKSPRIDSNQYNARSLAASKLVPVIPKPPGTDLWSEQCGVCGTMHAVNSFEHIQVDELGMQLIENNSLLQYKLDRVMAKKYMDGKDLVREASLPQSKEFLDVLEIFQVNKEEILKILQDPDSSLANHFQNIQISSAKRELTKSGSFPVAYLTYRNNVRSSKLKHKLREIETFTKREPAKLTTTDFSDDTVTQPFPLVTDGNEQESIGTAEPGKVSGNSLGSSHKLKNQGDNRVVTNRFKNIKRRIKRVIKGNGKERHRISMDSIFHKIPSGCKHSKDGKKEMSGLRKELTTDRDCDSLSSCGSDSLVYALCQGGLHPLRRTASLTESLDRYSQLFESTFSREAKQHLSDRLKLTNEDAGSPGGPAPKPLGRILSLPELRSFCSMQSEVSHVTSRLGMPTSISMDSLVNMERSSSQKLAGLPVGSENESELEASVENASQEILVGVSESSLIQEEQVELILNTDDNGKEDKTCDNLDLQTILENDSISHYQQEVEPAPDACIKQAQPSPNSVLDSHTSEVIITEEADSGLKPRPIDFNELDSLVNLQDLSCMDSPYANRSMTEVEIVKILSKHFDSDLPHVQVNKKDESNFNFVRDALKLSGFSGNGNLRTWHLPDQPVDPSLFEEVDSSRQETGCSFDHQLLFDVINEVLIDIYERSFMYWPRPLSINLNIRPMPVGCHVLEEVWASICWFLRYQSEPDESLDYIVDRDLAKADGWMNLHYESECVGLELEEWIWDELLEEVIVELEMN